MNLPTVVDHEYFTRGERFSDVWFKAFSCLYLQLELSLLSSTTRLFPYLTGQTYPPLTDEPKILISLHIIGPKSLERRDILSGHTRKPAHTIFCKMFHRRPQFRLVEIEIVNRTQAYEIHPREGISNAVHERATRLAEVIGHRLACGWCLRLTVD